MFIVARFSPYEWSATTTAMAYGVGERRVGVVRNQFTISNALWYPIGMVGIYFGIKDSLDHSCVVLFSGTLMQQVIKVTNAILQWQTLLTSTVQLLIFKITTGVRSQSKININPNRWWNLVVFQHCYCVLLHGKFGRFPNR